MILLHVSFQLKNRTMRYLSHLILLLTIPFVFSSCAKRQLNQLKEHQDLLSRIANDRSMEPEKKMDIMMGSFTSMMSQGLKIVNPKKGGEYVAKYTKENKQSIDKILEDVGNWQQSLGPLQKTALAVRMTQKPYAKEALDLIPQFRRKYKQIKFVANLTKGISSKVFGLGLGKILGN